MNRLKNQGLDYIYVVFEVDNETLEDTVKGLQAISVCGQNIAMPNKVAITQYLDKLTPATQILALLIQQ